MKQILFLAAALLQFSLFGQKMGLQTLSDLSSSPAGSQILTLVNVVNSGNQVAEEDVRNVFAASTIEKNGVGTLIGLFENIRQNDGNLSLYDVDRTSTFSYSIIAKGSKGNEWLSLPIGLEQEPPHKVNSFAVRIVPQAPKNTEPIYGSEQKKTKNGKQKQKTSGPSKDTLEELDSWLQSQVNNTMFSGSVLVAKDFQPVFHKAYGLASKRYGVPNTTSTIFRLASVSKIFTATAILQLSEQGKLSLDDKLGQYIQGFKDDRAKNITIRQLLNHRSGWSFYWSHEYYLENKTKLRSIDDYLAFLKDLPLEFDPGSKTQYTNVGPIMAGAIIEKVTGKSYYDYVDEHIFRAAGMNNSGFMELDHINENLATGYTNFNFNGELVGEGFPYENVFLSSVRGVPAGGGTSTTGDLLKFCEAVATNKLINEASEAFLRSDLGVKSEPGKFIFHNGGGVGQNTWMQMDVESGYAVIVLSNYDPPAGTEVVKKISELMGIDRW